MTVGFLVVDKPAGVTSHDVVAVVRALPLRGALALAGAQVLEGQNAAKSSDKLRKKRAKGSLMRAAVFLASRFWWTRSR